MNWRELFSPNYVMRLATHTLMYMPAQYLPSRRRLSVPRGTDIKLLCGTSALYMNMLRPLPTWNTNYLNYGIATGTVCLGVSTGANFSSVNLYMQALYRKVLSRDLVRSVRDGHTKHFLQWVGLRAWNTGCPTLWGLTPEHCEAIVRSKGDKVVFTLTSYHPNPRKDRVMVDVSRRNYSRLHFWSQSIDDLDYLQSLEAADGVEIVMPNLAGFREVPDWGVDHAGNHLHEGIFALQHKQHVITVVIDYHAQKMAKDYFLPLVGRDSIETNLADRIESFWSTVIHGLDFDRIEEWEAQFDVDKLWGVHKAPAGQHPGPHPGGLGGQGSLPGSYTSVHNRPDRR